MEIEKVKKEIIKRIKGKKTKKELIKFLSETLCFAVYNVDENEENKKS